MKFAIIMPTTFNIDVNSQLYQTNNLTINNIREMQYIEGIQKIYDLNKNKNIDFYIFDNSKSYDSEKITINNNIEVIKNCPNNYGGYNKGSGIIEMWNFNKDIIKKYDWIIHFEPRQLLENNNFINDVIANPRNLFTIGTERNHFNTGLFSIESKKLIQFINECPPQLLVDYKLGIEYALYQFFINNKISYDTREKMELIWFPTNEHPRYM